MIWQKTGLKRRNMNHKPEIPPTENHPNVAVGIVMRFGQIAIVLVFQAVILFLAAGRLNWTWAWVFLGICLVSVLINGTFLLRTSPETAAERGRPKEMKDWDKVVGGLWGLAQYLVLPLVAGLDVRFGWTPGLSAPGHVAGGVVLAVGLGLFGWAMIANAYFSTAVRIQSDRGQTVCRTGPYRFVRHPGYVGAILQSLGTPFLLGSLWALIPGIMEAALVIIRTSLEDRMLQAELPGYRDFVQEVRYRLVPGIW
jgi:protein-S-isoprenylcysteine O-methyltransferase Ste14